MAGMWGGRGQYGGLGLPLQPAQNRRVQQRVQDGQSGPVNEISDGAPNDESEVVDLNARSSSRDGLPSFGLNFINRLFADRKTKRGKVVPGRATSALNSYDTSIAGLAGAPAEIENQRVLQGEQFRAGIQDPIQQMVQGVIQRMSAGGGLNSSVFGDAVGNIAREGMTAGLTANRDSNIWASGEKLKNLMDMVQANRERTSVLGDFLGLARKSESSSVTPRWPR